MRNLAAILLLPAFLFAQDKTPKKVDFATQIWPILQKRCVECHETAHVDASGKTKKPKGGVVLDTKEGITTSKKGKLVIAKKPDDSLLYQSITLPADDEDRMPPQKKGDPLAKAEIELIKAWIEGGADLGKWTGKAKTEPKKDEPTKDAPPAGKDTPAPKGDAGKKKPGVDPLVKLQKGLAPLPAETLAAFAGGPFTVRTVHEESPLLTVSCAGHTDEVDDAALRALLPIATHVAELDLARSKVADGAFETIAKMPRLVRLDLRQTGVGNGITALAACKELRSLNVFGTKVSDYGMAALAGLSHLEHLYVWQTEVSPQAVLRLREAVAGVRVVVAPDLPEPMADAAAARRRR